MSLLRDADRRALIARWSEPHRVYHTVQHLEECLAGLRGTRVLATRPDEVEAALWFHDAIYDSRATDSEGQSAALAERMLGEAGVDGTTIARITQMILATRHVAPVADPDAQLVCDLDLSILAAKPERFAEYERQVREEYAWVPLALFRAKRALILEGLLARPSIYQTRPLIAALEQAARANLVRSLEALRAGE